MRCPIVVSLLAAFLCGCAELDLQPASNAPGLGPIVKVEADDSAPAAMPAELPELGPPAEAPEEATRDYPAGSLEDSDEPRPIAPPQPETDNPPRPETDNPPLRETTRRISRVTPAPIEPIPADSEGSEPPAKVEPDALRTGSATPNPVEPSPSTLEGLEDAEKALKSELKGRPIARIGSEVITLPELTEVVKERLRLRPTGSELTRKQIIQLIRMQLQRMIETRLVMQEARRVIGDARERTALIEKLEARWEERELPRLLEQRGVARPEQLQRMLAWELGSLDDLRESYTTRALARELCRRESGVEADDRDLAAFYESLRRRYPISSILSSRVAELTGSR